MRDTVFISYSHSDVKWLEMLKVQLSPYKDAGSLTYWDDTKIGAGEEWFKRIEMALASAKVAVLLVSAKFLASDFIKRHEIPPLLAAARDDGLRIVWVAVDHCAYEKTWLGAYNAASDPAVTLDMLEEWEQKKVLKKVCEVIEAAAVEVPHSTTGPQVAKTPYEKKRCDRAQYLKKFGGFFNTALETRPGLPHVYVVHGNMGENHNSFAERMYHEVFQPVAGAEQSQAMLRNKPDIKWPTPPAGAPEKALKGMQEDLQQELSGKFLGKYLQELPAARLADSLPKCGYYILEHSAVLERWSDFSTGLFDWYLNEYWAALARASAAGAEARPRPQLFCLIKILYPEPGFFSSLFRSRLTGADKKELQDSLGEITARANLLYPCMLLDELLTPSLTEVYNWYVDNQIYGNELQCSVAAKQFYKEAGRKLSMALIETRLDEVYSKQGRQGMPGG